MIFVVSLSMVSAIGGFLFGYDTGVIGGATLFLNFNDKEATNTEKEV